MQTLNIIGAGRVGKSLGRIWSRLGLMRIECVLNQSVESAVAAVEFLGQGRAVADFAQLTPANWVMLSVPDDALESACKALENSNALAPGTTVFHCSGSRSSCVLEPLRARGCLVASMHPVKTFADPVVAAETFAGTPCALEGDKEACRQLSNLVEAAGAKPFAIQAESKLLYHAGAVMVCNYLAALIEAGLRCYQAAGLSREQASAISSSLIAETLQNIHAMGPAKALTGPISRGDAELVREQYHLLAELDPNLADIYRALGKVAVELAHAKCQARPDALNAISAVLAKHLNCIPRSNP